MRRWSAAVALVAILSAPALAEARWPDGSAKRLMIAWPDIQAAAEATDLPPGFELVLAAIATHETGVRGIRGGTNRAMTGPMQVHWDSWGERLIEAGIADSADDLLDVPTGIWAGAFVLAWLLQEYSDRGPVVAVCLFGCGTKAENWERCTYSEDIADNIGRVLDAVGGM